MTAPEFLETHAHFGGFDFARQTHHLVVVDRLGRVVLTQPVPETAQAWAKLREALQPLFPLAVAMHWLADLSRDECVWTQVYYQKKRDEGKGHAAALRCLAGRWQKILWKMIQSKQKYDPERHMQSLVRHGSWVVQLLPEATPATT